MLPRLFLTGTSNPPSPVKSRFRLFAHGGTVCANIFRPDSGSLSSTRRAMSTRSPFPRETTFWISRRTTSWRWRVRSRSITLRLLRNSILTYILPRRLRRIMRVLYLPRNCHRGVILRQDGGAG